MMRRGGESEEEEAARAKESRRFAKHVRELLGGAPDVVFEHVGRATFPTSVLTVKPFGKVVICGATSGYQLDFDVRYLWMRQKQIIGSHFANAYEATRANELIESGKIHPVLWKTMTFDGVAEAHQSMYKNEHRGQDRRPGGRGGRGPRRAPRTGPVRSARRWGPDGRSRAHPLVRHAVPGRPVRGGRRADRAARAPLRRDGVRDLPVARRRATRSCSWRASRRRPSSSATGTARSSRPGAPTTRASTRCRSSTSGTTSSRAAGSAARSRTA